MATDKLVDFDHVTDYISREAAKAKKIYSVERRELVVPVAEIDWIPPADVVASDCYDRILAENDTMREMLARIGKKCGDSMDDVRPVVKAAWEDTPNPQWPAYDIRHCPCCGWSIPKSKLRAKDLDWNYCPHCGADMREPNLDTTKGDSHD